MYSQPGLASVPQSLLTIREEAGLAGQGWEDLGKSWHTLAALWLRAETRLSKSGRTDLKYAEVHASSLPFRPEILGYIILVVFIRAYDIVNTFIANNDLFRFLSNSISLVPCLYSHFYANCLDNRNVMCIGIFA